MTTAYTRSRLRDERIAQLIRLRELASQEHAKWTAATYRWGGERAYAVRLLAINQWATEQERLDVTPRGMAGVE